jgi:hypothetical protein
MNDEYSTVCTNAARTGDLEKLKQAYYSVYPMDGDTCRAAADNGHLKVLRWALSHECPWIELTCSSVDREGDYTISQYGQVDSDTWTVWTFLSIGEGEDLKVLLFVRHTGPCVYNNTFREARLRAYSDILENAQTNSLS